jgi:hypothetical protein
MPWRSPGAGQTRGHDAQPRRELDQARLNEKVIALMKS